MFCNHCGKPNPDGSKFCSSCGHPIVTATAPQPKPAPTPQPAPHPAAPASTPYTKPAYTLDAFDKRFRVAWREFASSPFALLLLIFHSVCTVLNIVQVAEAFDGLESVFELLDYVDSDLGSDGSFVLALIQIVLCAPGILIAIGMWMTYADSLDQSDRPLNTKGLSVIYWVQIGTAILYGLAMLCVFVSLIKLSGELNEMQRYYGSYYSEVSSVLTWCYIILIVVTIVAVLLIRLVINLIDSVRDAADYCNFSIDYVVPMAVVEFIASGISIVSLFTTEVTFIGLLTTALPILFGIMLLRYKSFMESLYYEKEALKANERVRSNPWA